MVDDGKFILVSMVARVLTHGARRSEHVKRKVAGPSVSIANRCKHHFNIFQQSWTINECQPSLIIILTRVSILTIITHEPFSPSRRGSKTRRQLWNLKFLAGIASHTHTQNVLEYERFNLASIWTSISLSHHVPCMTCFLPHLLISPLTPYRMVLFRIVSMKRLVCPCLVHSVVSIVTGPRSKLLAVSSINNYDHPCPQSNWKCI